MLIVNIRVIIVKVAILLPFSQQLILALSSNMCSLTSEMYDVTVYSHLMTVPFKSRLLSGPIPQDLGHGSLEK